MRLNRKESPEVYRALVAELSLTLLPTTMMGITLFGIGVYSFFAYNIDFVLPISIIGSLASMGKMIIILLQLRLNRFLGELPGRDGSRKWELAHIVATTVVSCSVGGTASLMFHSIHPELHLLATALLFGYCSGVSTKLSPRPFIANTAMIIAGIPVIICAYLIGDNSHHLVALIFLFFLFGGIHSVICNYRSSVRNISMRLTMERLARNDPLTGLENRLGLREAFHRAVLTSSKLAVHCLDLDGFKGVNDMYGHAAGDEVLNAVANRLIRIAPEGATVARIGGDEFVVLQRIIHDEYESDSLRCLFLESLRLPFNLSCATVNLSGSVGTAISDASSADLDSLLRDADEKLYQTKRVRYRNIDQML